LRKPKAKRTQYNIVISQNRTPIPLDALFAPNQADTVASARRVRETTGHPLPVGQIDEDHPETAIQATTKEPYSKRQNNGQVRKLWAGREKTVRQHSKQATAAKNTAVQFCLPARYTNGPLIATTKNPPNR
jgi:hypothetical protein